MAAGGPDGSRRAGKAAKTPRLPANYAPPGQAAPPSGGPSPPVATPPILPTAGSATTTPLASEVESLKAVVETLQRQLQAQEASQQGLLESNRALTAALARASAGESGGPSDSKPKALAHTVSDPGRADGPSSVQGSDRARAHARRCRQGTTQRGDRSRPRDVPRGKTRKALPQDDDESTSDPTYDPSDPTPPSSPSSSDDDGGGGPPGPPTPPSSAGSMSNSDSDPSSYHRHGRGRRGTRGVRRGLGPLEHGERRKVIRPSNSRFKSLMDYRTYFLVLRSTAYPPSLVRQAHKMNRRLDGAFQGQEQFDGSDPLGIFTFLTTFRRACDAAGLTHGQAFPLLGFRLSGHAKRAFASATNTTSGNRRYALRTYGDAVNWLLAKYATHDAMSSAYHNIITLRQGFDEQPRAFGTRVETLCDRLDGLFHAQDVKDVFTNGLQDVIKSHVRVLDSQFPDRSLADTVTAAQMYWDGVVSLRQALRTTRSPSVKVAYAGEPLPRAAPTVDRPFPDQRVAPPMATSHSPRRGPDRCYNCYREGHYAAQCPEPPRKGARSPSPPVRPVQAIVESTADEPDDEDYSKNE